MPNKEACGTCARRKVRCDKQEPSCGNCKRRKGDRCVYPSNRPEDRIRKLEALVRKLGGDPNGSNTATTGKKQPQPQSQPQGTYGDNRPVEVRSGDPIVLEEDGHTYYVESRVWQDWLGKGTNKSPFTPRKRQHAFSELILNSTGDRDLSFRHPSPIQAAALWSIFTQRIDPIVRITFTWKLRDIQIRSTDPEGVKRLSAPEHAFVLAIYFISIVSLSEGECGDILQESRQSLVHQYHTLCEAALVQSNLFCITDLLVIKALIFYMMATYDDLISTQSLWSLMGIAIRNAEKLGLHRDGLALGLSPEQTEERRRIWWQLQHIDLCLGIWMGSTPITLMADWDAKIPLNIEDDDISSSMTSMPEERKGLTSASYCRYTYWAIDTQRKIFRARQSSFALSWQCNALIEHGVKEDVLTEFEEGLNKTFLQYCDPIKPLDNLVLLSGRYLVTGLRLRVLHGLAFHGGQRRQISDHIRAALLDASVQCLKYNIAIHSQEQLKKFHWYTRVLFSWHSFMFVLVEASHENDFVKAQETWDLLAGVYASNSSLFELSEDRRRHHAAELVVAAWKAWQNKLGSSAQYISPPSFVSQLELGLAEAGLRTGQDIVSAAEQQQGIKAKVGPITPESIVTEDANAIFDMDFQDIDWSFWSSMG